jgi:hypothetical protein
LCGVATIRFGAALNCALKGEEGEGMSTETLFLIEIVAGLMIMATILTAVSTAMTANTLKRIEQLLAQRNSN